MIMNHICTCNICHSHSSILSVSQHTGTHAQDETQQWRSVFTSTDFILLCVAQLNRSEIKQRLTWIMLKVGICSFYSGYVTTLQKQWSTVNLQPLNMKEYLAH